MVEAALVAEAFVEDSKRYKHPVPAEAGATQGHSLLHTQFQKVDGHTKGGKAVGGVGPGLIGLPIDLRRPGLDIRMFRLLGVVT